MAELKSLTVNGKKYDCFVDQTARASGEGGGGSGGGGTGDKVRSDNLVDIANPTTVGSDFTFYENEQAWHIDTQKGNHLKFNLTFDEPCRVTFSAKFTEVNCVDQEMGMQIRNSSNETIALVWLMSDGVWHITHDIAEAGEYLFCITGANLGNTAIVSEIMVNYGEKKPYQPYYIYSGESDSTVSEIADYNLAALDEYIEELKSFEADVKIPVMTDLHTEKLESYAMFNYLAKSGCADMCVALGDYIPKYYATKAECFELLDSVVDMANRQPTKSPVFMLRGNHDTNIVGNTDSTSYLSDAEFYDRMETRTKNIHGVSRRNYGYVDLESAKVRVVMLDAADVYDSVTGARLSTNNEVMIQQEQFAWFASVALDFTGKKTPTDWSVIVFSHANFITLCGSAFRRIVNAFTTGGTISINDTCTIGGYTAPLSVTKDYSAQGALTFICTVSGHQHADMVKELKSGSYPNITAKEVFVAAENSGAYYYNENNEQVWYTRTAGTIEEHCFDTVCIDKTNRKVIFKRLGIGSDREISY